MKLINILDRIKELGIELPTTIGESREQAHRFKKIRDDLENTTNVKNCISKGITTNTTKIKYISGLTIQRGLARSKEFQDSIPFNESERIRITGKYFPKYSNYKNIQFYIPNIEKQIYINGRIVWLGYSYTSIDFSLDDSNYIISDSFLELSTTSECIFDTKYLLCVLNSSITKYIINSLQKRNNKNFIILVSKQVIGEVSVPNVEKDVQKCFAKLVDYIFFFNRQTRLNSSDRVIHFYFRHVIEICIFNLYFKTDFDEVLQHFGKQSFDIFDTVKNLPKINSTTTLKSARDVFNEINNPSHTIRLLVSLLKNYEPFKTFLIN